MLRADWFDLVAIFAVLSERSSCNRMTLGVPLRAEQAFPAMEETMDEVEDDEESSVWKSIRFFVYVALALTLLGVLFFAVA